jgi:hypothetical protein
VTTAQAAGLKQSLQMKTIIERGASWTLEETKLLLTLWGQDQVSRKDTPHKRTKEVYEKISEKFNQNGFERTPDQVRTRVFNMIAEYRRILKDPNPERMKKCIFFDAMHKIYQAQHWTEVKSLIEDYDPEAPFSPASNSKLSEMADESISDSEAMDGQLHDNSSIDASNASNSVSNNNNNSNAATSKSAPSNDTTANTTNSSTNDCNSAAVTNNQTGATSDNSINDNNAAKKNPASKDGQLGASAKRVKIDPPKSILYNNASNSVSNNNNNSNAATSKSAMNNDTTISANTITGNSSNSASVTNNRTSATSDNSINDKHASRRSFASKDGQQFGTAAKRIEIEPPKAILYQAPVNTFDVTSSALLIDRMFAHLSRESENMREWIALEKDRIALEKARRAQETEREIRRERVLIDTLMKFHEQWISFVSRLDPRLMEGATGQLPELNIPPKETDSQQPQQQQQSQSQPQQQQQQPQQQQGNSSTTSQ